MISISCWNIRGLNDSFKQEEIKKLIRGQQLDLMSIIETKVRLVNKNRIMENLFRNWDTLDNYSSHPYGRI